MSLLVAPDALTLLALLSVAKEISPSAELWSTRPGGVAGILAIMLNRSVQNFGSSVLARSATRAMHFVKLVRRLSPAQIMQIFLDKYDSGYHCRSYLAARGKSCAEPVVLQPSAYENVSRMAAAYARLLPGQPCLLVATRQSAKRFVPPPNVQVRDLAAYATVKSSMAEVQSLIERWVRLRGDLQSSPDLRVLLNAGLTNSFPGWIRDGLAVRNAWREVLEHEPVCGVLCGDDSNLYTRLPVLLAARRNLPTVDFHHGAFDGRYVLKELPSDVYLAKNEMERDYLLRVCGLTPDKVVIGSPPSGDARLVTERDHPAGSSVILFSEPYEVAGMRPEEVYRELLPSLCGVARESGHGVIIKLHPFESLSQRRRMVRDILTPEDCKLVIVVDGPLTSELMARAWFAITVESTTVIDCLENGICCFLCGWLSLSPFEYVQQYARFGVGEVLQNAQQLSEIPIRLAGFHSRLAIKPNLSRTVDPVMLQRWLTKSHDDSGARPVS